MKKISVILPIYNVEKYLKQCLDSVSEQTLKDIEIICINDGSTDDSKNIVAEYARADSRVILITQKNSGYGKSVNVGIERANGEYIAIVEPDDFLASDMYAKLYALAEQNGKPDIVKSSYYEYIDYIGVSAHSELASFTKLIYPPKKVFTLKEYPNLLYHHPSIWSCIYRTNFLKENNIRFVEEKGAGWVDNPFFMDTMTRAKSIVWTRGAYYYYRKINPESSTNAMTDFSIPVKRSLEMHDVLDRNGVTDENILSIQYNRDLWHLRLIYRNCEKITDELKSMMLELVNRTDRKKLDRDYIIDKDLEIYERKVLADCGLPDDVPQKTKFQNNLTTISSFTKIYGFVPMLHQLFKSRKK